MRITLRGKRWLSSIGVGRKGDAGLIITGNVMVDRHALTGPAGVVLEDDRNLGKFRLWADACRSHGAQAWMQINHPGRQLLASMGQSARGPCHASQQSCVWELETTSSTTC